MSIRGNITAAFATVGGTTSVDASVQTITEKYTGKYSVVAAKADNFTVGIGNVKSVSLVRQEGDVGELTVIKTSASLESGSESEPAANYELSMVEVVLPLPAHPNFKEEWLELWGRFVASPREVQVKIQALARPEDPNSATIPCTPFSEWCELYNSGIQTYRAFLPVVRKVQVYVEEPTPDNIGYINTPPKWSSLASAWLKTGDNISYDGTAGKWTRSQQWTGNHEWPKLLYTSPVAQAANN